jgi:hypothetical protein
MALSLVIKHAKGIVLVLLTHKAASPVPKHAPISLQKITTEAYQGPIKCKAKKHMVLMHYSGHHHHHYQAGGEMIDASAIPLRTRSRPGCGWEVTPSPALSILPGTR